MSLSVISFSLIIVGSVVGSSTVVIVISILLLMTGGSKCRKPKSSGLENDYYESAVNEIRNPVYDEVNFKEYTSSICLEQNSAYEQVQNF